MGCVRQCIPIGQVTPRTDVCQRRAALGIAAPSLIQIGGIHDIFRQQAGFARVAVEVEQALQWLFLKHEAARLRVNRPTS